MQVVRAVAGDERLLASLEQRAMEPALGHVFQAPYPLAEVCERWRTELVGDVVTIHLARDPEPVGYLAHDGTTLLHVGVLPERWGTGVADALVALLPDGVDRLWVMQENHRARRFYERRGWAADGRERPCEFTPFPTELGYRRG